MVGGGLFNQFSISVSYPLTTPLLSNENDFASKLINNKAISF